MSEKNMKEKREKEETEEYTYAKTRHSIRKLLDLAPKES